MSDFSNPFAEPTGDYSDNSQEDAPLSPNKISVPDFVNEYSGPKASLIGVGKGMVDAYEGVKDTGAGVVQFLTPKSTDIYAKVKEYRDKLSAERKIRQDEWDSGMGNDASKNRYWAKGGEFGGNVAAMLPFGASRAGTMPARMLWNAIRGGLAEFIISEKGKGAESAIAGGLGGALGTAVVDTLAKGGSALAGKWADPQIKAVRDKLVKNGFKPRVGDLAKPKDAVWIRAGEDAYTDLPFGKRAFQEDIESLTRAIVPDNTSGKNVVAEATKKVDKALSAKADEIYTPFYDYVRHNKVPGVRPVNLKSGLEQILKHDDKFINSVSDAKLRKELYKLVKSDQNSLKAIPVDDYLELKKALGGMTEAVKARSHPAPGAKNMADKNIYAKFTENITGGLEKDMAVWNTYSSPSARNAQALYKEAFDEWNKVVLPWKQSEMAYALKDIPQHGADKTANLLSGKDQGAAEMVRKYLKQYGPYDSEVPIDALTVMRRQANKLGDVTSEQSGGRLDNFLNSFTGLSGTPGASLSRNNSFQNLYFGDPLLGSSPLGKVGRNAAQLYGTDISGFPSMAAFYEWLDNEGGEGDENDGHSIGADSSTRGQGGVK